MTLDASVQVRAGELAVDVTLDAKAREPVALVGPNGAGKTTTLRALAGLAPLTGGHVRLAGVEIASVSPERRRVGFLFQGALLFPHLTAIENVEFGPRARGLSDARERARGWLDRVGASALVDRPASALSGGEAQRVALARALAAEPRLLLLDEPLSGLDARARREIRRLLVDLLATFDGACVLVTHDPLDALTMAKRLVVLEKGKVVQSGSSAEVTRRPRSRWVAEFVGVNLFRGRATAGRIALESGGELIAPEGEGDVFAVIHPRAVALYRARPEGTPRNVVRAVAESVDDEGDRVRVTLGGSVPLTAEITAAAARELDLRPGTEIWASVKASEIAVDPA